MIRDQFKRASGYGTGGSEEKVPVGEPIRHIYVDGQKYPVSVRYGVFTTKVAESVIYSESLDILRDLAVEVLSYRAPQR